MAWSDLSEWWLEELEIDPAYEEVVTPLLLDLLQPDSESLYLDLGAGEGRIMRAVAKAGSQVHGVDLSHELARYALDEGPVVVGRLPELGFFRRGSYDGAYAVLVLEHVPDHTEFFRSAASAVRSGGVLVVVMNHPVWTAPGSTPITDADGEVLWRPGQYFEPGSSSEPAGPLTIDFHHRSVSSLVNAAAHAGWSLERSNETAHHFLEGQEGIPRLLACRWRLLP